MIQSLSYMQFGHVIGNTVELNWSLEQKPTGELVVLGSGSYGKVLHRSSCLLTNDGRQEKNIGPSTHAF